MLTVYVEQATVLTYFKKFLKHHEMVPSEEVFRDYTPEEFDTLQDFSSITMRVQKAVRVAFRSCWKNGRTTCKWYFRHTCGPNSNFRDKLKVVSKRLTERAQ